MTAENTQTDSNDSGSDPHSRRFNEYVPGLLELVNDLVISLAPDAKTLLYANRAAETIYGRPRNELLHLPTLWFESIDYEDQPSLKENLATIDEQIVFEQDFKIVQTSGARRWLEGNFQLIKDSSGKPVAIGCIAKDITSRIKAEQQLEESKAIYHSLVESLPINVLRKDRDGRLVFANNKYCQTLKKSRDELMGKSDFDLFSPELAEKYSRDDRWVLQTGLPFHDIEFHPISEDKFIYVEVLKAPVTDAKGRRVGIQGMFWDVTDRKKAEIDLQKAKEMAEAASLRQERFSCQRQS